MNKYEEFMHGRANREDKFTTKKGDVILKKEEAKQEDEGKKKD